MMMISNRKVVHALKCWGEKKKDLIRDHINTHTHTHLANVIEAADFR